MMQVQECIICLDENNLLNKSCTNCSGILIHETCFNELLQKNGTKCPCCRGRLLRELQELQELESIDLDSSSSMNSEVADEYITRFRDRIRQRNIYNNIIINNNDNDDNIKIKDIIKVLISILILSFLGWVVGCLLELVYCLILKCSIEYFKNTHTEMLKLCIGTVVFGIIVVAKSDRNDNRRRRAYNSNNHNVNRTNIQNRIV